MPIRPPSRSSTNSATSCTKTASYKFDLKHMRVLCEALDSPHTKFPSVLIAGTNGKGSTAATLASILRTAGYRTGLYTSPHLVRINERIRIDGEAISDADFAAGYECVHAVGGGVGRQRASALASQLF